MRTFTLSSARLGLTLLALTLAATPQSLMAAKPKGDRAARSAPAGDSGKSTAAASATDLVAQANVLPLYQRRVTLKDLGVARPLSLRGVDGDASVGLSVRLDEMVESARLHLSYTLSPALLPNLSHLKILLNDEVLQTLVVDKDKLGSQQTADLNIDARYFTDFNRLRFQLIGHYTMDCELPNHSSLWASISNDSYLEFGLRQLPLKNDLALLPAPFFDQRDNRPVNLAFVYGSQPSTGLLKASGSVATWLGMLASYRGTRFSVLENGLPDRHAVVLATNANRPDFLKDLPSVAKPTLAMASHPTLVGVKLLLVLGQDESQVQQAADALALGKAALTGESMAVTQLEKASPRQAYDAPRWLTTSRPVQLGELVQTPGELQTRGTALRDVIRVNTQMAPDLFTWNTRGVPMNLQYRHTPTGTSDHGSLELAINDQFIKSYPLMSSGAASGGSSNILLPLFDDSSIQAKSDYKIPAFLIGGDNQLQFTFQVPPADIGRCRSVQLPELRAAIDPESTIDLTDFYHYTAMPNMAAYANSGFPFTKFADLAQTSIVLPTTTTPADIEVYLTALGRMGASTGYAGTRFKVLKASELERAHGTDILMISRADSDGLLGKWGQSLPTLIEKGVRSIRTLDRALGGMFNLFKMDSELRVNSPDAKAIFEGDGPLAAIYGLESPLDKGRSVVILSGSDASSLKLVSQTLTDPGRVQNVRGDLSFLRGTAIESFRVNPVYYVGDLPWWRRLWFSMHNHPLLLAAVGIVSGLILSLAAYVGLRTMARRRLEQKA
jgi:hypothetical protein